MQAVRQKNAVSLRHFLRVIICVDGRLTYGCLRHIPRFYSLRQLPERQILLVSRFCHGTRVKFVHKLSEAHASAADDYRRIMCADQIVHRSVLRYSGYQIVIQPVVIYVHFFPVSVRPVFHGVSSLRFPLLLLRHCRPSLVQPVRRNPFPRAQHTPDTHNRIIQLFDYRLAGTLFLCRFDHF